MMGGRPRVVFDFTVEGGLITRVHPVGDPEAVALLRLELLGRN